MVFRVGGLNLAGVVYTILKLQWANKASSTRVHKLRPKNKKRRSRSGEHTKNASPDLELYRRGLRAQM